MTDALTILLPFLAVLAVIVLLRVRSEGKLEIKTSEIVLAAVPVALWMLATGRLESLTVGDLTIKAFRGAAAEPAGTDARPVEPLLVQDVRADAKAAVSRIPDLVARRTEALTFRLGSRGYAGFAVQQYLDELTAAPYLRWVVIEDADGRFWGLADAREVDAVTRSGRLSAEQIAERLNSGEEDDRAWLAGELPGFVSARDALPATASRQEALRRFEQSGAEALPALDADGRLKGMVRRDALLTGLLADVTARLDGNR